MASTEFRIVRLPEGGYVIYSAKMYDVGDCVPEVGWEMKAAFREKAEALAFIADALLS